ncbi:hypothetical protein [Neobacillus sp. PS3-40]|uniref:hypothetical protein n=1 Tax=Neobacillus sp. PS3-40 TaxID=3070679 RepID=UPI0027DFC91D|nr:hypothetical protein [Neobacillus sp. PS3-40]WML43410.1 hypothetical protein RCG20_16645 [Neobacillus sp. PS3-40]
MGYILPIPHEQNAQYQMRDIKSNYNFYQITQVPRTNRSSLLQEKTTQERVNIKSFPEITGKGRFIDKRI